jgi:hypothetical protein
MNMFVYDHSGKIVLLFLILLVSSITLWEHKNPWICKEYKKVVKIVAVHYRSCTVLFEDGTLKSFNQAMIKPEDLICTKWSR